MAKRKKENKNAAINFRVTPTFAQELAEVAEILDTDITEVMISLVEYAKADSKLFVKALRAYRTIDTGSERQLLSMA